MPQRDDIDFLRASAKFRTSKSWVEQLTSTELWASWNGHRQVIPRLLASGLLRIGNGDFRVLMVASLAIAMLTIPAVLRILPTTIPYRRALAALTVFALNQSENWLWGYQLAWFVVNCGVVWAVAFTMWAYDRKGRARITPLLGAFASCIVATLSSAHGVMSWFAVACVCALLGRRIDSAVWGVAGLISALLIRSSEWSTTPNPIRVFTVAVQLVGCALKLPAAWIRRDLPGGPAVPFVFGVVLILLTIAAVAVNLRGGHSRRKHIAGLLAIELYVAGFVVMASVARSDPFYETPAQSRYSTVTLLGLLCLVALLIHARSSTPESAGPTLASFSNSRRSMAILGCLMFVGVSMSALPSVRGWLATTDVIERCVNEWKPNVARAPDCKYDWSAAFDNEWKTLRGTRP
jgi:hypothetical protein